MRGSRALRSTEAPRDAGLALLSVLLVLLALFVLCTPFLFTARSSSKQSMQLADRVQARLALDSAERHARAVLGRSHRSHDSTPYFDDEDELWVDNDLDPEFLNASDPRGTMWDVEAEDLAGRIDLSSAGPQVIANILGVSTRLSRPIEDRGAEIAVSSTRGFDDSGFLWIEDELIGYARRDRGAFLDVLRGLAGETDADGEPLECGPQPPDSHGAGTPVIDQRAFAPVLWRIRGGVGFRPFSFTEEVREAAIDWAMAGAMSAAEAGLFHDLCTVYGDAGGGPRWQKASRLTNALEAGLDCELVLDDARWFNPGTTIRITDGETTEYGIVLSVEGRHVHLMEPLSQDYRAYSAEVRPLARRPVNVNTARPEVLKVLFTNLQLRGINSRITAGEADELVQLVVLSRPFEGAEDFLRRIVLPAAGIEALSPDAPVVPDALAGEAAIIDRYDALALYANALNANDTLLAYSTMPFSFVSRDTYRMELRASVNAPSGVERIAAVREDVHVVVPQGERHQIWARQEDFDEQLRLTRESPWWASGPNPTSHYDRGVSPPSRIWPNIGVYDGHVYLPGVTAEREGIDPDDPPTAEHIFPSRDENGWVQLWPSRVRETPDLRERVLHFDHETKDPEGRYLPDEIERRDTEDDLVGWTTRGEVLLRALDFSLWIKPLDLAPGLFLDVTNVSSFADSDRITLGIEDEDLVLRVQDGAGNHSELPNIDGGVVRFPLAPGDGPGLAPDTWTHVSIDVRGNAPDQMTMLVDGRAFGVETPGLTRLTAPLPHGAGTLAVEDTDGFPDFGVVRVGDELIEYQKSGSGALQAVHQAIGPNAGMGGRMAREVMDYQQGSDLAINRAITSGLDTTHEIGTPVQLYGYSAPISANVPAGSSRVDSDLGLFGVGLLVQVLMVGDPDSDPSLGEPIVLLDGSLRIGRGMDGNLSGVRALILHPADPSLDGQDEELTRAFNPGGGYAAVVQRRFSGFTYTDANGILQTARPITRNNANLTAFEIVRYTSAVTSSDGTTLHLGGRGGGLGFANPDAPNEDRAFVIRFENLVIQTPAGTVDPNSYVENEVFVFPVSVAVPGASSVDFLPGGGARSEFAQITHLDQAELTEWVRYDELIGGHLVRNDALALEAALDASVRISGAASGTRPPPPPPGPPPPPAPSPPHGPAVPPASISSPVSVVTSPRARSQSGSGSTEWIGEQGTNEFEDREISRAVSERFQFRGVFGTFCHEHAQGTPILPVFRIAGAGINAGLPGHKDKAFLMEGEPTSLGFPVSVHRAYNPGPATAPGSFVHTPWEPVPGTPTFTVRSLAPVAETLTDIDFDVTYVALDEEAPIPLASVPFIGADTRLYPRLVKFPSGERPRVADQVVVGGALAGGQVPSAVVDEVVFGSTEFGEGTVWLEALQGAGMRLALPLSQGQLDMQVEPHTAMVPFGPLVDPSKQFLSDTPPDAGLMRMGAEILAYDSYDASSGAMSLAPGGRGMLGTEEQHHEAGSFVYFFERQAVSTLTAAVGAGDGTLPIEDDDEFPTQGTVLIGEELIHYTRLRSSALEMPRASETPGEMDGAGPGVFRGRFGSQPTAHQIGAPVVRFPFRYWDRWADRFDGPELSYAGFSVDQPSSFWTGVFWSAEESTAATIEVLQRTDTLVPWDAPWEETDELQLHTVGMPDEGANPVAEQSDLIEWRAFVRYAEGAFDGPTGSSHGWKETPRLRLFGASYRAPYVTLRRVER